MKSVVCGSSCGMNRRATTKRRACGQPCGRCSNSAISQCRLTDLRNCIPCACEAWPMHSSNNRRIRKPASSALKSDSRCWWIGSGTGVKTLERRLKEARLQGNACVEDIDFREARGLDKPLVRSLIQDSDWVRRHQHIFL